MELLESGAGLPVTQVNALSLQAHHGGARGPAVALPPPSFAAVQQPALLLQPPPAKGSLLQIHRHRVPPGAAVFPGRRPLRQPQRPVGQGLHGEGGLQPDPHHQLQRQQLRHELQLLRLALLQLLLRSRSSNLLHRCCTSHCSSDHPTEVLMDNRAGRGHALGRLHLEMLTCQSDAAVHNKFIF